MTRSSYGKALTIIGFLAAVAYLWGWRADLFHLHFWAKPIPVACMFLMTGFYEAGVYRTLVRSGLALSMTGDMFMSDTDRFLLWGMGAFALAHLCYIGAYLSRSKRAYPLRPLPLVLWFGLLYAWLAPKMGAMLVPVTVYMAVIGIMVWRASALVEKPWKTWSLAALIGAVIFAVSDSLIAVQLFHGPFWGDRAWVILTYWAGQWLITRSVDRK